MTDKEKIKDCVKNLKSQAGTIPSLGINALAGFQLACDDVIAFIDSLPEEPASEDLEEAAEVFYNNCKLAKSSWWDEGILHKMSESKETFIAGAEWQRKKDQETIELAEDHAMLAGMMKEREEMMKDAVDAIFIQDYAYKTPVLYGDLKYKMNIVSGQPIKLCQIKEIQQ